MSGFFEPIHAAPIVAVEFDDPVGICNSRMTVGWEFSTDAACSVTALGFFDYEGNGLRARHEVGIYSLDGVLLVSTIIFKFDPLEGHFRYHDITPYLLSAGDYRIAAFTGGVDAPAKLDPFTVLVDGGVTAAGITFQHGVYHEGGVALQYPELDSTGLFGDFPDAPLQLFGPNFQWETPIAHRLHSVATTEFTDLATRNGATVPEPSTFSLVALVAGLCLVVPGLGVVERAGFRATESR